MGSTSFSLTACGEELSRETVTVPALAVPGDLTGDDDVTDDDALYLLYHVFFPEDYPVTQNCDYNGDGDVTDDDALYLLYHVFFPEDYPIALPDGKHDD